MKFIIILISVLSLVNFKAEALKCYACAGAGCEDPFNPTGVTQQDCSSIGGTSCAKAVTTAGGIKTVVRICSPLCKSGSSSAGGIKVETACCSKDLCNDSSNLRNSKVLSVSFAMIALVLSKLF